MLRKMIPHRVDILAMVFCCAGLISPDFLLNKANRLVAGVPVSFAEAASGLYAAVVLLLLFAVLTGRFISGYVRLAAVSGAMSIAVYCSGAFAYSVTEHAEFARVSLSTGFWFFFLGCILFFLQAYSAGGRLLRRQLYMIIFFIPSVIIILSGGLDRISVMLEYASYSDRFVKELWVHIAISFGSVLLACGAGIPLGIFSAARGRKSDRIFDILNIVQTIPSIALFGLLMVPLAWLASRSEIMQQAGISGIGWAPAVTALFLYSLLPVVRNTYEGIRSIDEGVRDAAKGVGMTGFYRLFKVELPLSMPVILNGVRVALVQAIGNTAVVSLIGAGGMGIFIFQGLGQAAVPLIMLGTIPTIVLAVAADSIMNLVISFSRRAGDDRI